MVSISKVLPLIVIPYPLINPDVEKIHRRKMVTGVLADADPRGDQRLHAASVSEKDSHVSTSQSGRPQRKPIYTCITETVNPNTVVFSMHCCLLGLE